MSDTATSIAVIVGVYAVALLALWLILRESNRRHAKHLDEHLDRMTAMYREDAARHTAMLEAAARRHQDDLAAGAAALNAIYGPEHTAN